MQKQPLCPDCTGENDQGVVLVERHGFWICPECDYHAPGRVCPVCDEDVEYWNDRVGCPECTHNDAVTLIFSALANEKDRGIEAECIQTLADLGRVEPVLLASTRAAKIENIHFIRAVRKALQTLARSHPYALIHQTLILGRGYPSFALEELIKVSIEDRDRDECLKLLVDYFSGAIELETEKYYTEFLGSTKKTLYRLLGNLLTQRRIKVKDDE